MSALLAQTLVVLGWVSAVAGAGAYLLASRGTWDAKSVRFQVTNLTAASLMVVVASANGLWPSVAANFVWVVIGTQSLVGIARSRRAAARSAAQVIADAAPADAAAAVADAEQVLAHAVLAEAARPSSDLVVQVPIVDAAHRLAVGDDVALPTTLTGEVPVVATQESSGTELADGHAESTGTQQDDLQRADLQQAGLQRGATREPVAA
ncbi:hypothetical protein CLV28_2692 [Sediminihabitans luteus]|uniref:CBU-0592-like domain-containing protein n=1 Tax=Sediminihabitans luteus TaxID=1138585 RepID=A0A2M9CD07_9CELL|nr:hypothetical protein [Sediminihabitans luteus]PJJ69229.1 hypothetical protein CLV28_2692 [Sediminihabitans luteus]GII98905.1 hypothetical protein Slu03_12830 [Sediminihabitans luteus]